MAKKKEEIESKEYNQCTFKPKIIQTPELEPQSRADRFEQLYKIGTSTNLNKKDKKKEDFEINDEKVLTFKPNIDKYQFSYLDHPFLVERQRFHLKKKNMLTNLTDLKKEE
jgi:hypothetical protein